jgi:hypothetical protein
MTKVDDKCSIILFFLLTLQEKRPSNGLERDLLGVDGWDERLKGRGKERLELSGRVGICVGVRGAKVVHHQLGEPVSAMAMW